MSVISMELNSALIGRYQTGLTSAGGPVFRQKTLNYIKADASEQDVYDVLAALFSLSQYPLMNTFLRKNFELIDQE